MTPPAKKAVSDEDHQPAHALASLLSGGSRRGTVSVVGRQALRLLGLADYRRSGLRVVAYQSN